MVLTDEIDRRTAVINIVNYMTGLMVRAWQYKLEYLVIQGDGNSAGQPTGIVNDPSGPIALAVPRVKAGELNYKDLVKLDGELDEIFSEDAFWLMRKKTLGRPSPEDRLISASRLSGRRGESATERRCSRRRSWPARTMSRRTPGLSATRAT